MARHPHLETDLRIDTTPLAVRIGAVAVALALLFGTAACGDDSASGPSTTAASGPAADAPTIDGAWARTSPMGTDVGAAYANITSPADDALVDVRVDGSVAGMAQLHEMAMGDGQMTMQEVDRIELPAGTTVALEPGGYHVMLMQLVEPLEVGRTIRVTFVFEVAGEVVVDVPVLDEAP